MVASFASRSAGAMALEVSREPVAPAVDLANASHPEVRTLW
jgi:hypothetical protein